MAKIKSSERVLEYSKEFKYKIVQLTEVDGIKTTQVAKGLGLHPIMIYRWRQEYRDGTLKPVSTRRVSMTIDSPPPSKPSKKRRTENEQLRAENQRLRKENDLLKKWKRYLAEVKKSDSSL